MYVWACVYVCLYATQGLGGESEYLLAEHDQDTQKMETVDDDDLDDLGDTLAMDHHKGSKSSSIN